jgi:hypothetical protein
MPRRTARWKAKVERLNLAQKIVDIEEACKSVLGAIAAIEHVPEGADIAAEQTERTERIVFFSGQPTVQALKHLGDPRSL